MASIIGKTFVSITGMEKNNDEVTFVDSDGVKYKMYHSQNCCETVEIEDVIGDVEDLLNTPILSYECVVNPPESDSIAEPWGDESSTWTFYHFRTIKGSVTIRWYGTSNGYYSESVNFEKLYEGVSRYTQREDVE